MAGGQASQGQLAKTGQSETRTVLGENNERQQILAPRHN